MEQLVLKPSSALCVGLLIALLLHTHVAKLRAFQLNFGKRCGLGVLLLGWGAFVVVTCVRQMAAAGTASSHDLQTTVLLRTGFYSYSRNPQYLGGALIQLGMVLLCNSLWVLLNTIGQVIFLNEYVIPVEEAHLTMLYKGAYSVYCSETPRWLSMDMGRLEL